MEHFPHQTQPQKQAKRTETLGNKILAAIPPRAYGTPLGRMLVHAVQVVSMGETDIPGSSKHLVSSTLAQPIAMINAVRLCSIAVSDLDDRLDSMSPEKIVGMGETPLGITPSEFLMNPQLFTKEDVIAAKKMLKTGALTKEEGIAFCNLASHLVREEARMAITFRNNPTPENRHQITEFHMQLSIVCGAIMYFIFDHTPAIKERICHNHRLTYDDIKEVFPVLEKGYRAIQMQDEAFDLICDLREEIKTGRPSPNWFLSRLHERGALYDDQGRVLPYLQHLARWTDKPEKSPMPLRSYLKSGAPQNTVQMDELPGPLQNVIYDGVSYVNQLTEPLPDKFRTVTRAHLAKTIEGGLLRFPSKSLYLRLGLEPKEELREFAALKR